MVRGGFEIAIQIGRTLNALLNRDEGSARTLLQERRQRFTEQFTRSRESWSSRWSRGSSFRERRLFYPRTVGEVVENAKAIVESSTFSIAVTFCICLAGILIGIETYPSVQNNAVLTVLENAVLLVFVAEIVLKIIAKGSKPWRYFTGRARYWNVFDFLVVFFSLPFWSTILEGSNPLALLRLIRLMRIMKIVKRVPQLEMIINGLMGGLKSIGYILLLLFLVFYLFGIAGIYVFRASDPFHFANVLRAMLTMLRIATLSNWHDIMFVNMMGCEAYNADYVSTSQQTTENQVLWCTNPKQFWVLSPIYFVVFTIISALVMLSLFIGTVTMSMASSLDRIKQERQDKERKARKAKFSRKVKRIKHDTRHALPVKESTPELVLEGPQSSEPPLQPKMHSMTTTLRAFRDSEINAEAADAHHSDDERSKGIWKHWKLIKSQTIGPSQRDQVQSDGDLSVAINRSNSARKFRNIVLTVQVLESSNQRMLKNKMKHVLLSALVDDVEPDVRLILDPSEHHLTGWTKRYAQLSRDGGAFVSHPHFKNVIILTIMVAAIVVGAETYSAVNANVSASLALTAINYMIISIFISEVVLKVVAEGLYPWTYFMDAWNVFDFLIVIGSIIPAGGGKAIYVLRLLRLIRILKLVKSLPQLAVIVNAMIMGMASIGFIGMILFLTFYVCAIAGIILFEQNDPFRFGSLHLAIITLFSAATLDTWCDSLYTNMFGCDIWGYHNLDFLCTNPTPRPAIAVIFFVCFTILTALVLLTLFIGVVTTSMDEAAKTQEAERQQQEKVREVSAKHCLSETTVTLYREVFDVLDVDKNGLLDIEEMKLALESIGHPRTPEAILVLFRSVNPESDGQDMDVSKFIHFIETLRRAKAPTKTSQYETGRRSLLASLFHSIRKSSQASTGGETHPETGYISLLRKMSSRLFHPHPPMSPKSMQAKEHKQSREVSSKEAHSKTCLPRIRKSARVQPTPVDVDTEDEKVTEKEDETLTARRLEFTHQRIMPDG